MVAGGMAADGDLATQGWQVISQSEDSVTLRFFGIYEGGLAYTDEERRADPALDGSLAPSREYLVTYSLEGGHLERAEVILEGELTQLITLSEVTP